MTAIHMIEIDLLQVILFSHIQIDNFDAAALSNQQKYYGYVEKDLNFSENSGAIAKD